MQFDREETVKIIGIDPGTTQSGYVKWDTKTEEILEKGLIPNEQLLNALRRHRIIPVSLRADAYVVETYDGATPSTCYLIGRILEITGGDIMQREAVRTFLRERPKTKDSNLMGVPKQIWNALAAAMYASRLTRIVKKAKQ